jgi:hypothetical protein
MPFYVLLSKKYIHKYTQRKTWIVPTISRKDRATNTVAQDFRGHFSVFSNPGDKAKALYKMRGNDWGDKNGKRIAEKKISKT